MGKEHVKFETQPYQTVEQETKKKYESRQERYKKQLITLGVPTENNTTDKKNATT